MSLVEKLVAVSKEIGFLEFDKKNTGQGYKYVSAASVIRKLNLELAKHGLLAYVSTEFVSHFQEFVNTKGNKSILACVTCGITFTDGTDSITAYGSGSGSDAGDKAVMKAATAAYKYAIAHALTLGWDAADPEEDNAPASSSSAGTGKPAKKPKAAKADDRRKVLPPEVTDDLMTRIEKAKDTATLDKLRDEVLKLKDNEAEFQKHKQAVMDRRAALEAA